MKRLIISLAILIGGCNSQRSLIESQFSYNGRFNEYETFGFISNQESLNNGLDRYDNRVIQSIIYKRFMAMGYSYEPDTPDLLITFRYFQEGTRLIASDQKSLTSWINSMNKDEEDEYLLKRVVNNDGTLSIFFIDRITSNIVFQGYYKDYQQDDADYRIVSSIGQILDKYQITKY